jgi:hypothetical protein
LYTELGKTAQRVEQEFKEFKEASEEDRNLFISLLKDKPKGNNGVYRLLICRGAVGVSKIVGWRDTIKSSN